MLDLLPVKPFWLSRSATQVAPDLIGCTLVRQASDNLTLRGVIVETEATILQCMPTSAKRLVISPWSNQRGMPMYIEFTVITTASTL